MLKATRSHLMLAQIGPVPVTWSILSNRSLRIILMHSHRFLVNALALFATCLIDAEPPANGRSKKDLDTILGSWKVLALQCDGEAGPPEVVASLKLLFKEETLIFQPGEPGFTNFRYKMDPTSKPASFDMIHADGSHKGDTKKGIYVLENDHLKICFGTAKERPTQLTANAGSRQTLYSLIRVNP